MARCDVGKGIMWNEEGEWLFAVLNYSKGCFYFLVKMQYDPTADGNSSEHSNGTRKTVSKERSERSNEKLPDLMAKTMKFSELIKLKQTKNTLDV